jgi:hypothetical protein
MGPAYSTKYDRIPSFWLGTAVRFDAKTDYCLTYRQIVSLGTER